MHEDFWFIKAAIAALCLAALAYDAFIPAGYASEAALVIAVLILALDARRDRSRDFWHSI